MPTRRRRDAGFTLLELLVVIVLVAILFLIAIDHYLELLVDVERAAMEQTVGTLRSAVALQMAGHLVRGDLAAAEGMAGTNPMHYLSELPPNYLGELDGPDPAGIIEGSWYFDLRQGALVYRVIHGDWFRTDLPGPDRARFRIVPVYGEVGDGKGQRGFAGLSLRALEPYRWLKKKGAD